MSGPITVACWCGTWHAQTVPELDALLDAIGAVAAPGWVDITGTTGMSVLGIALGRPGLSALTFADTRTSEKWTSDGWHTSGDDDTFARDGLPLPLYPRTAIAVTDARTAVREYFQTPARPTCIEWQAHDVAGYWYSKPSIDLRGQGRRRAR